MHADAQRASPQMSGFGPEAALARCLAPAWVIDPAGGRVLAANAAGAARLGLRPDAASGTLDAAMPGLVRLRALMHEPLNGGRREPLIFWTAYGAESLLCNVSAVSELDLAASGAGQHRRRRGGAGSARLAAARPRRRRRRPTTRRR